MVMHYSICIAIKTEKKEKLMKYYVNKTKVKDEIIRDTCNKFSG